MARRRAAQQQQAQQAAQNVAQSSTTTTSATTTTTTQTVTTQTAQAAQNLARRGRAIRGPQSALTDFLASHNISANQIRLDHERRRQQAQSAPTQGQHDGDDAVAGPSSANANSTKNDDDEEDEGAKTKRTKRKLEQDKAIEKIKNSKRFQKRKKRLQDSDEEDDLIEELLRNAGPQPGQMENCDICNVRFTVTPYSKAGPSGGLLCTPCGKDFEKDQGPAKKKKKLVSGGPVGRRRKAQSNMLDGTYILGAKSLMSLCIETLAKNIDLADDLGYLPPHTIDKIARMLSKKRLLNPNTLNLFLQPTSRDMTVYDTTKLTTDDLVRMFQLVPSMKSLKLKYAIQFKDEVMEYLLSRDQIELESLHIHGANLLSSEMWLKYLTAKGKSLQTLQVYYTDNHFDDKCLAALKDATPSLQRIKVYHNQKVTGKGIGELAHLKQLQHLSVHVHKTVHSDVWVKVLSSVGGGLKTLSLVKTPELDNTVLDAIHTKCRHLSKLRITDSEVMTDAGFARLFTDWRNTPLTFVDLQKCRQLDSQNARSNADGIGLCSDGFKALMAHSGRAMQKLNLHSCRHISTEAFEDVFAPEQVYPELKELELSFCEGVTDFVVGSVFRSCPQLKELNVFGCMTLKDVRVPRGKILVGMPNALGMVIEGQD